MEIEQEEIIRLISRYLEGTAEIRETEILHEWLDKTELNKRFFMEVKNIWDESGKGFNVDSESINSALHKVLDRIHKKSFRYENRFIWYKAVAVIIIPVLIMSSFLIYLNADKDMMQEAVVYNEVHASIGDRCSISLSDGSHIWLNSGSSLKYPGQFSSSTREVYLSGEGYFEVKSDTSNPFIVHVSSLSVKATGTKFNISESLNDNTIEVTLETGKVFVNKYEKSDPRIFLAELKPDQQIVYNIKTKESEIRNVDSYIYTSWKDGKLIFEKVPLTEFAKEISKVYNVDIELRGNEIKSYLYHATFEDETFDEILKILKLSAPIEYTEISRKQLPDGSFTKRKVVIYSKNKSKE